MIETIRRLRSRALGAFAALLVVGPLGHGDASAQPSLPTLRVQHMMRPQSVEAREFQAWASQLDKDGIARLDVVAAAPGRPASSLIDAVRGAALDVAVVPMGALGTAVPHFNAFNIPFLFRDPRHALHVQFDDRRFNLLRDVQSARFEPLGWWPGEMLVLMSRKPVLEPGDLRGLRVASASAGSLGQPSALALFAEKLGAVPSGVAPSNALAAFAGGELDVIEAALTELPAAATKKPSVTLTQHLYAGYAVIAHPGRWAALPPAVRDALRARLARAHDETLGKIRSATALAQRDLAQKHGASIFQVPSTQAGDWDRALRSERMAAAAGDDFVLHVRGAGFPATGSIRGSGPAISWNAWFEEGSEANPKDVETLQVNGVYRFNLDLARYAYTTALSAGVDRRVLELLSGQGERRLLLQPVLLGPQLVAAPGSALRPRALAVQLARASATPQDAALLQAFDNGKLTARALSQQLNLGAFVSWEVKAEAAGCAGIAVIVWDQARVTPLDHIVLQVPVKSGTAGPQSCASGDAAQAMNAGLRTLLAGPAPAANARVPDAALHVFEHREGGAIHSRAVLIHRQRLLDAQAKPAPASQPADAGVYSWRLGSALSSYVSDDGQMSELIKGAHKAVAQPGSSFPFEDVATELSLKIFSGASPHDKDVATQALAALRDAIDKAAEPAVIVRVVNASGNTLFVPFGLLAAQARQPTVAKRFTVIQPLPSPRPAQESCIDTWRAVRPRELQGVGGDARDLLRQAAQAAPASGIRVIDNHASLAEFLAGNEGVVKGRGDGLIVLAHHDRGYLKFNDADRPPARVASNYITREFSSGSVAVLAACTATGDLAETRAIVDQLARQGVDALIVSPFAVDAEFGTRLALEFEKVVADESAKRSGATLLQVFERASIAVAAAYKNQGAFRDMALEFMLIGNPEITLCK